MLERSLDPHSKKKYRARAVDVWLLCLIALSLLIAGVSLRTEASAVQPSFGSDCSTFQDLIPRRMAHGKIETGDVLWFRIALRCGDLVRLDMQVESTAVIARILGPDKSQTLLQVEPGERYALPISWEAKQTGDHWVVLRAIPMWGYGQSGTFRLCISQIVSSVDRKRNQDKLQTDPRVEWLKRFAQPVRTIDPKDDDLSDLLFLESRLQGVRIVLLGESHHGNGSDFLGKTRLIRFLHQRLGFNVLAFEAGLYDMEKACRSMQSDQQPERALAERLWRVWRWSEQFQPLIEYVVRESRSPQPLRLTGFDCQFSGRDSATSFIQDMQQLLQAENIESPLLDKSSRERTILQSLFDGVYDLSNNTLPPPNEQQDVVRALQRAAEAVQQTADSPSRECWAHVLHNICILTKATFAELQKKNPSGSESSGYDQVRDEQMAQNLAWLANRYLPDQKFIVSAHTVHIIRNPQMVPSTRNQKTTMGHGVWKAFGDKAYFLGFTSYQGAYHWVTQPDDAIFTIVPDQDQHLEFEEMMQSLGHRFAVVDLREAKKAKSWLGGEFVARPLLHAAESAKWSNVLDALFFIKEQEPSRKIPEAR